MDDTRRAAPTPRPLEAGYRFRLPEDALAWLREAGVLTRPAWQGVDGWHLARWLWQQTDAGQDPQDLLPLYPRREETST